MTAFAPPDAAAQVGLVRNEAAERRARLLLRESGEFADDRAVQKMAAEIVAARTTRDARRAYLRELRAAQVDHDEYDTTAYARRRGSRVSRRGTVG